jgi:hypothetical protein
LTSGVYTLKSNSLGTVKLEESKIRAIRSTSSGRRPDNPAGSKAETSSLQEKMMSNADIMAMIQSLQNDPEFRKALEDPELLKAVNSGDVASLIANPKFMNLLNNATVQDIQKKVK